MGSGLGVRFGPPVTVGHPIGQVEVRDSFGRSHIQALTKAGMALQDVLHVSRVSAPDGTGLPTWRTAQITAGAVRVLARAWPEMGLRDAVGWMLWAPTQDGFVWDDLGALVGAWLNDPTIGADGWVYAAAGFSASETASALRAGALDAKDALAMVGLRAGIVPVG